MEKQLTGISGEFFVAAELVKRNYQVALSFGGNNTLTNSYSI